jgi:putative molybdopterin biosynthesis protein
LPKHARGSALEDEFLTVEEIAKRMKVKPFTVRDWIRKGELPAYKVGRTLRVRTEDFTEFLKKHRTA